MRGPRVDLQLGILDDFGRPEGSIGDGDDLVIVAVHDQRRNIESPEIVGEVGLGEGLVYASALMALVVIALAGFLVQRSGVTIDTPGPGADAELPSCACTVPGAGWRQPTGVAPSQLGPEA